MGDKPYKDRGLLFRKDQFPNAGLGRRIFGEGFVSFGREEFAKVWLVNKKKGVKICIFVFNALIIN